MINRGQGILLIVSNIDAPNYEIIWPQPELVTTPLANPILGRMEAKFLKRALKSGWIGANGIFTENCEEFLDVYFNSNSLLVSNGSVALILALRALGIGPGDEVLLPDLTYAATASSVLAVGATPKFCDVELDSWNISVDEIRKKITSKTRAIIVVHLYGMPADLLSISSFASKNGLFLIEDCAEAFGAEFHGKKVGTIGDIGTFSFFPNKLLTSGEGGAVISKHAHLYEKMKMLRGQGMSFTHRYYFLEPGYNFRITELQAAILWAQLKQLRFLWEKRESSENFYRSNIGKTGLIPTAQYDFLRAPWIFTIRLSNFDFNMKVAVASKLARLGIETRPAFYPLSNMPAFYQVQNPRNANSELISKEAISLPTGFHVSKKTYFEIFKIINKEVQKCR